MNNAIRLFAVFFFSVLAFSQAAKPVGTVAVGDSPFALALSSDNAQAVVVNLFPSDANGNPVPNLRLIDVSNRTAPVQIKGTILGTRLVAVALTGTTVLIVNEDQDALRVVDAKTGLQTGQVTVGSRPGSVAVSGPTSAIVTNGTSGDISFVDLAGLKLVGSAVKVGTDPRAAVVHPNGAYAYIALGGDNALAVVDVVGHQVLGSVATGRNPVAVKITPDGKFAVVANLSGNTITVVDISSPTQPKVVSNILVGVQPNGLAINPVTPNLVYVANAGSNFFSVVDISKGTLQGVVQMGARSSAIAVTSDARSLMVTELQSSASLRVYDLANMPLDPVPSIDMPGEPHLRDFFDSTGSCSTSFYDAEATLNSGQRSGVWGMVVSVSQGLLTGGFSLGGGYGASGQNPGFGQFKIPSTGNQAVTVDVQIPGGSASPVTVTVLDNDTRVPVTGGSGSGTSQITFNTPPLTAGKFYVVEVRSASNGLPGNFLMTLSSNPGFDGGVVVGGFITAGQVGYGAFCVPTSQIVDIQLQDVSFFGQFASGDLTLTVKDNSSPRKILRTLNNAVPVATQVAPPAAPTVPTNIRWYVDASAAANGSGSSSSPFKSLTAAMRAAAANDVIFVKPGKYTPSLTGETIPMDAWKSGVQIIGSGAATTIIDAERVPGTTSPNAVIFVNPGIRFAGFTVRGAQQIGIFVLNAANVIVENNFVTSNGRTGISSSQAAGLIVRNNVSVTNQENGMVITGGTGSLANPPTGTGCPTSAAGSYNAYVLNNTSNDNRVDGILMSQGGNFCLSGNSLSRNGSSGIEFNNRVEGSLTVGPLNGAVVNNTFTGNGAFQLPTAGTGVLSTEGAKIDVISGNTFTSNRPSQIAIFLNAKAGLISNNILINGAEQGIVVQKNSQVDEISDNSATFNGLSGLFVATGATVTRILRNTSSGNGTGLSILDSSTVGTLDTNTLDRNGVGMEVAGSSSISTMPNTNTFSNNSLTSNSGAGVFIRDNSTVSSFSGKVRNNRGQGGMIVDSATVTIASGTDISSNSATGINLFGTTKGAVVTVNAATINSNGGDGGMSVLAGSTATLTGTTLSGNTKTGIVCAAAGSNVRITGGVSITNTSGIGLNAQNGGTISCSGSNTFSGNSGGNTLGAVTGCQ